MQARHSHYRFVHFFFRKFPAKPVKSDMRALHLVQNSLPSEASLLCELLGWNELEARIFLGSFGLRSLLSVTEAELCSLGLPVTRIRPLQSLLGQLRQPEPLVAPFSNSRQVFEAY